MTAKSNAAYIRWSSHAQDESSSDRIQVEACERALGGPAKHYIDAARTGRAAAGRTALKQLIEDCRRGEIQRVCVWRFSRIGRNLAESAQIIQELEDCGVQIMSATEGSDPLVRGIFLSMAEHYSRELASNTRDGLIARFKERAFTGGVVPFGYAVVEDGHLKRLQVNQREAGIIKQIVEVYLRENIGLKGLAKKLQQMGVPSRRGARWCHTTVRAILLNSMLVGQVRFLRRQMKLNRGTGRRVPKFRDDGDVVTYSDESLRILDDATFQQVQRTIQERGNPKSETPRLPRQVRAFTGLAYCAECGAVCYTAKSQNAKGTYYYLTCGNRCRHGADACPTAGRAREDVMLDVIRRDFAAIFNNTEAIIGAAVERAQELAGNQREALRGVKEEEASLDKKIASLMAVMIDPGFDADAKRAVSRELGNLQRQRELLHVATSRLADQAGENTDKLAAAIRMALVEAKGSLAAIVSPAEFNRFVARFVGPVVIRSDGSFAQKEPGQMLTHPTGEVAGARWIPFRLREMFWAKFTLAA